MYWKWILQHHGKGKLMRETSLQINSIINKNGFHFPLNPSTCTWSMNNWNPIMVLLWQCRCAFWLFKHTGRQLCRTVQLTSMDNITAELNYGIWRGESLQIWLQEYWQTLLLDFKSSSDKMTANCYCQTFQNLLPRLRTNVRVKPLMASSSWMTVPTCHDRAYLHTRPLCARGCGAASKEFFADCTCRHVNQWDACLNAYDDF
jgi:hypothetical protein